MSEVTYKDYWGNTLREGQRVMKLTIYSNRPHMETKEVHTVNDKGVWITNGYRKSKVVYTNRLIIHPEDIND